jgi:hypothetical protein
MDGFFRILEKTSSKLICTRLISFSSCQRNLIKTFQIEAMIALITKMSKKAKFFRNFRNKRCSIFMLHKIGKNKKCAPKLIFSMNFFLETFGWFLTLKTDFENQILALFDGYFWPFKKTCEKINAIFVISTTMASIWNVFIKFRWHDEKLTTVTLLRAALHSALYQAVSTVSPNHCVSKSTSYSLKFGLKIM